MRFVLVIALAAFAAAQLPFPQSTIGLAAGGIVRADRDSIIPTTVCGIQCYLESQAKVAGDVASCGPINTPAVILQDNDVSVSGTVYARQFDDVVTKAGDLDVALRLGRIRVGTSTTLPTTANLMTAAACGVANGAPTFGGFTNVCWEKRSAAGNAQLYLNTIVLADASLPAATTGLFNAAGVSRLNVKIPPRTSAVIGGAANSNAKQYSFGVFVVQHDGELLIPTDVQIANSIAATLTLRDAAAPGSSAALVTSILPTVFTFEKLFLDPDVTVRLAQSAQNGFLVARDYVRIQKGVLFDVNPLTQTLFVICLNGAITYEDQHPGTSDTNYVTLLAALNIVIGSRVNIAGRVASAFGSIDISTDTRITFRDTSLNGDDAFCNPVGVDAADETGWLSCGPATTVASAPTAASCCPGRAGQTSVCCTPGTADTRCIGGALLTPTANLYAGAATTSVLLATALNQAAPTCCPGDTQGVVNQDYAICCNPTTQTVCSMGGTAGLLSAAPFNGGSDTAGAISSNGPLWCCPSTVGAGTSFGAINNNYFCGGLSTSATVGPRIPGVCYNF